MTPRPPHDRVRFERMPQRKRVGFRRNPNTEDYLIPKESTTTKFIHRQRYFGDELTVRMCILSRSCTVPTTHPDGVIKSKEEGQFSELILVLAKTLFLPGQH